MNNDLISREALKKAINSTIEQATKVGIMVDGDYLWGLLNYAIDNAPTVPQGEWILKETDCDDGGNNRYECTNCHYSDVHAGSAEVPYCWHCGAEMKGGAE